MEGYLINKAYVCSSILLSLQTGTLTLVLTHCLHYHQHTRLREACVSSGSFPSAFHTLYGPTILNIPD